MNLNKADTKSLDKLTNEVEAFKPKFAAMLDELRDLKESIQHFIDGLEEDFDKKSEKWQESDKGLNLNEAISELTNGMASMEELESNLDCDDVFDAAVQYMSAAKGDLTEDY
jgi:predicted  nucleic acid-binding Zn-ribbon protein